MSTVAPSSRSCDGASRRSRVGAGGADWVPRTDDPDAVYDALTTWAGEQGLSLYPHQDEAVIELLGGANVVLATPTGSGKSLVAVAAHAAALAARPASVFTAPVHGSDQVLGQREVLRTLRDLRSDERRHADRRRLRELRSADHLLHRGGAGEHRPPRRSGSRRRARRHRRVPLLRRARPRVGVAGA